MKENLYNTIEQYINGVLQGEELQKFEQAMKEDANLRKEVALHQKLHRQLGDPAKLRLSRALDDLRADFAKEKKSGGGATMITMRSLRPLIAIAASILLLATLVFVLWKNSNFSEAPVVNEDVTPPVDTVKPQKEELIPLQDEEPQLAEEEVEEAEKQLAPPATPQNEKPRSRKPKFEKAPNYLAEVDPANFNPNPLLDPLTAQSRSLGYIVKVKDPGTFKWSAKQTAVTIEGSVKARKFPEDNIIIQLFSNKAADYKNDNPILEKTLELGSPGKAKPYTYPFQLSETLDIKPGLYYFIIKDKNRPKKDIALAGKFEVRKEESK